MTVVGNSLRRQTWQLRATKDQRRTWYYDWLLTTREAAAEMRVFHLGAPFAREYQTLRRRLREQHLRLVSREGIEQFVLQEIQRQCVVDKAIEGKGGLERVSAEMDLGQPIDIGVPNVLVTVLGLCEADYGWLQEVGVERRDHRATIRREEEAPLARVSERDVRLRPLGPRDNGKSQNVIVNGESERMESKALQFSLAVVLDERAGDGLVGNAPATIPPLLESVRSRLSQVVHMGPYISLDRRRRNGGRLGKPVEFGQVLFRVDPNG